MWVQVIMTDGTGDIIGRETNGQQPCKKSQMIELRSLRNPHDP